MPETQRYRSTLTALLTMAGVAIGLGNVWRFPYMMGRYGGSAFLLVYLALMAAFAIPALCAEWALGRHARSGTLGAFSEAFGTRGGLLLGAIPVIGILVADSYYMVVVGNILFSSLYSLWPGFQPGGEAAFGAALGRIEVQYGAALVTLLAGLWVVHRGLHRGIEVVSRWFVPFFGVVMLYLVTQTLMMKGAVAALMDFLTPDFGLIGGRELFAALGQACFSLGIGGTFMVIYGSYLSDDTHILRGAVATGIADTAAALLPALFVMPAILVFHLDMAAGPRLIFHTLPELFAEMPLGRPAGSLFLLALTLMAFLSAVAGLVVCLGALEHVAGKRLTRGRMIILIGAIEALLMWPSASSPSLIGKLDLIFGSGMQIFGAALAVIAATWGLGGRLATRQILPGRHGPAAKLIGIWLRWVIPPVFSVILGLYVYDAFISG